MLRFTGVPGSDDPYVRIDSLNEQTVTVLRVANEFSQRWSLTVDVNAVDNGRHSAGTLHGASLAWDLDVRGEDEEDLRRLATWLGAYLSPTYEVVLEATHVHVEFDSHRPRRTLPGDRDA